MSRASDLELIIILHNAISEARAKVEERNEGEDEICLHEIHAIADKALKDFEERSK